MFTGKTFRFGYYPSSAKGETEQIEWLMLDEREDGTAIAITRNDIDSHKYNETLEGVTWESCDLRKWLNGDFLDNAFSAEERALLRKVRVDNPGNDEYGVDGGNATEDYAFCLSIDELYRYFAVNSAMRTKRTPYSRGVTGEKLVYDHWWLRTPGETQQKAACVCSRCEGRTVEWPDDRGWVVDCSYVKTDMRESIPEILGVRPVICVDLTGGSNLIAIEESDKDVKMASAEKYQPMELFVRKRIGDNGAFDLRQVYGRHGSVMRALKSKVTRGVPFADGSGECSPYAVMLIIYGCDDVMTHQGSSAWSNSEASAYGEDPKEPSWYREIRISDEVRAVASRLDRTALSKYLEELCFEKKMIIAMPALGAFGDNAAIQRIVDVAKMTKASSNAGRKNIYVARGSLLQSDEQIAKDYVASSGLREAAESDEKARQKRKRELGFA